MTTPTPTPASTPAPTTAIPATPPAPAHRTVRDRARGASERGKRLLGKVRIYPTEISNRQHVYNWIAGAVAFLVIAAILMTIALANPNGSSRYSAQTFSGQAGLVVGIGILVLALYSGFWLVKRKAWHAIAALVIIALVVIFLTPIWLRLMIGISRMFFSATIVGVIAGVISLLLTIYLVIRLGNTTSYSQELQDAQTDVTDKERALRNKQHEVDNEQAQIAPMETTKRDAETAATNADTAYQAAVKDREDKGKIRDKFVKKDKTVPAAELQVKEANAEYSDTRDQTDELRKVLKFTGSKVELQSRIAVAVDALTQFDATNPAPLTGNLPAQRRVLVQKQASLIKLDDLLTELAVREKAVKDAEKNLKEVTKKRDKKPEVKSHIKALKAEQEALKERDEKNAAVKVATKNLNAQAIKVGELEEARDGFATARDESQAHADTIEADLGTSTAKFLGKLLIVALLAMFLFIGFAR